MEFKPLKDNVLVTLDSVEDTTKSGIIIPENAQEKPRTGTVKYVGSDVHELQPGDRVMFGKYATQEIKVGDETYHMTKEDDIYGVLV